MVLVDTSVWVLHFREVHPALVELLENGRVLMHPFVLGELACGNLRDRNKTLADLAALPQSGNASNAEVMHMLDNHRLWRRGLGWIDLHLLAAALITDCRFWTLDKRLGAAASAVGVD